MEWGAKAKRNTDILKKHCLGPARYTLSDATHKLNTVNRPCPITVCHSNSQSRFFSKVSMSLVLRRSLQ